MNSVFADDQMREVLFEPNLYSMSKMARIVIYGLETTIDSVSTLDFERLSPLN